MPDFVNGRSVAREMAIVVRGITRAGGQVTRAYIPPIEFEALCREYKLAEDSRWLEWTLEGVVVSVRRLHSDLSLQLSS